MSRSRRAGTLVAAAIVVLAGCTTSPRHDTARPAPSSTDRAAVTAPTGGGASSSAGAVTRPAHVVVVVFENKAYRQVIGDPAAPYLNALSGRAARFTNAHAETHPSQPNYIALFSGSTQGISSDRCLTPWPQRPNLGSQLIAAGDTFTGYAEDLPTAGYRGCVAGRYAAKHNPWVDFGNVPAAANQPYTRWPADLDRLPTVAFVIPNLCNDMHDCGVATGDAWARAHLDPYLRWADRHASRLVVTFDENDGSPGNQIATLIAGAGVRPAVHTEPIDHYTLLRTIEDWYGLPPIGNAATASPISDLG
jgi:phosphatidylinositol-3-phosphatase